MSCTGPGPVELNCCCTAELDIQVSSQLPPTVLEERLPKRFINIRCLAAAIRLAIIESSSCAVTSDQIARKMAKKRTDCSYQIKHRMKAA